MNYNKEQEEAINTIDGALLIVSCPGSGKTTTMLRRIQNMIEHGISPNNILMVTFTEAAAREMRERFEKQSGRSGVLFCTLHSLCLRIINVSGKRKGYHIIDAQESNEFVRSAVRNSGLYLEDLKNIKNDISRFKNTGDKTKRTEANADDRQFMSIVKYYEDEKSDHLALDFDDLLIVARELLENNSALRDRFSEQYKYIICDEYQDTNPIQKDVLYLLSKKYGNLCVVGDDDQSIYGFRGATPDLMLSFPHDFPNCKVIRMGTNYRSIPSIISPSGKMIMLNRKRFDKKIEANRSGSGEISFESYETREAEMDALSEYITGMMKNHENLKTIAILARTNQELEEVALKFTEEKIPFIAKEALSDLYESWMFKDICAYLRIASGTFNRSDVIRVINRPKRYVDVRPLMNCAISKEGILNAYRGSKGYVMDNLFDFFTDIDTLRMKSYSERVAYILDMIGYRKYVHDYCAAAGASIAIHDNRLNVFMNESKRFSDENAWMKYAVSHVMRFKESLKEKENNGVILSTMHRSKGLEWDHVLIIDCCDGNVPLMHGGKIDDVEEERRLFYVACTRAKNDLHILSYLKTPDAKGELKNCTPSSFVSELRHICNSMKEDVLREKRLKEKEQTAFQDFSNLDLKSLSAGMNVNHTLYGCGKVMSVKPTFFTVRFSSGIKMFGKKNIS